MSTDSATPLVSIGMPVYNGSNYVRVAIDAILAQTFTDFELIISDNASEDDTREICEQYASKDDRIKYSRLDRNLGAFPNFNRVWELSSGKYFKWASHDDWISPYYLERCVEAMEADDSVTLAYGQMCRLDAQENTQVAVHFPDEIVRSGSTISRFHDSLWTLKFYPIFGLFRASAFAETMGLTNNPEPDRILLAEMALRGRFAQIPHITLFQRSSVRKSTWLWLSADNKMTPFANTVRSVRALMKAVGRADIRIGTRVIMYADLLVWTAISRVRGKIRQIQRRYHIGWGRGPKLDPLEVESSVSALLEAEAAAERSSRQDA